KAVLEAPPDGLLRNVVTALAHAGSHAADMQVEIGKGDIPAAELDSARGGFRQQAGNGVAAQCRFEGEVEPFCDRLLEQIPAALPGARIGLGLRESRIRRQELARGLIRVVIVAALAAEHRTRDAALAGA